MATQKQRVLAVLKRVGPHGITVIDFLGPQVCDGGKPITRVAARINDLRAEGLEISSSGTRHGCAVYRLVGQAVSTGPVGLGGLPLVAEAGPVETATLFDPVTVHQPVSPYDRYEAA